MGKIKDILRRIEDDGKFGNNAFGTGRSLRMLGYRFHNGSKVVEKDLAHFGWEGDKHASLKDEDVARFLRGNSNATDTEGMPITWAPAGNNNKGKKPSIGGRWLHEVEKITSNQFADYYWYDMAKVPEGGFVYRVFYASIPIWIFLKTGHNQWSVEVMRR